MSYIVHGVEIPKNCGGCGRKRVCAERVYLLRRPDPCPLEEIKTPHGRLIDKDKLRRELFWNFNGERIPFYDCDNFPTTLTYRDLHSILAEQPTIIEAEGDGE